MRKFISSGGVGDFFIVRMKIQQMIDEGLDPAYIDWIHVESVYVKDMVDNIEKIFPSTIGKFLSVVDKDYVSNIQEWLEGRESIPTPVQGRCNFYKKELPLRNPFLSTEFNTQLHDIVIQCSAGVRNDRNWKDLPRTLSLLRARGRPVTLIGSDPYFYTAGNELPCRNLVGKTSLLEALEIVRGSNLYIGLSGFLNYFACACKKDNLHLIESPTHEKNYYHPEWKKYTRGLRIGAPAEILSEVIQNHLTQK